MSFATYSLKTETQLLLGGLESREVRQFLAAIPTVEQLMPPLSLDDLGVTRWQPPEDAAAQLTTPMSATDRRRRQIRRPIQSKPDASDRRIAEIAGCHDETIASYRRVGKLGKSLGNSHPSQRQQDSHVNVRRAEQKRAKRRNMKEDNE
jgi:hypothetical protein